MTNHSIVVTPNYFSCVAVGYVQSRIVDATTEYCVGETIMFIEASIPDLIPTGKEQRVVIRNVGKFAKGLKKGYEILSFNKF